MNAVNGPRLAMARRIVLRSNCFLLVCIACFPGATGACDKKALDGGKPSRL